jgi:adenylosuccinate lyase
VSDDVIPDVLADRYASEAIKSIWSPGAKVLLERELWIAVMRAQRSLGVDIPEAAIDAYEAVAPRVDLAGIRARERVTRHDVKARIDEFCALAGHQHIHKGLTSRDLTENVEQLQILRSLRVFRVKYAASLWRLADRAEEFRDVTVTGRTHNVPAQVTTVGKRLAMFGQEMLIAFERLEALLSGFPFRGLKGPVGTQLDLVTLLRGGPESVERLESEVAAHLGFQRVLSTVGQIYPRSIDFEVLSVLCQMSAGPSSFAKTLRLMAGHELASEGFQAGQVGSSAMPHKVNSRSCERISGLHCVLNGFLDMTASLAGDQWNEGDVSCSVVRRVALPGAMFALDGLLETFLTVVAEMEVIQARIEAERRQQVPFLASTTILMEAVRRGAGRETAHEAIKEHSIAAARANRLGDRGGVDLLERLAGDARLGMAREDIEAIISDDRAFAGNAYAQTDSFIAAARDIASRVPGARDIKPGAIL